MHWLPIAQRVEYKLCLLTHLSLSHQAPVYLSELVIPVADIPSRASLRSSNNHDVVVPGSRLKFGERAFSVAAPRIWNTIPSNLKDPTLDTKLFKKGLKTFLFKKAYS